MRTSTVSSFLVALVVSLVGSSRAVAQDAASVAVPAPVAPTAPVAAPAPAAEPARAGDWSIGAGVSARLLGATSLLASSSSFTNVSVPVGAVASLERRLASSTWLSVGVQAFYARNRSDEPPAGFYALTRDDYASAGASLGIRQQITGAHAPVAVSILALAEGGWADLEQRYTNGPGVFSRRSSSGWAAGASLGLAVERELTSSLALRLSTPLLFASYSETRSELDGTRVDATGVRAGVALAPSLELRLYF